MLHELCCDYCGISRRLQQVVEKGAFDEDILLIRPDGEILKLSCYIHKLPGTDKLSTIAVVIRELQLQIHTEQTKEAEYKGKMNESIFHSYLDNTTDQ